MTTPENLETVFSPTKNINYATNSIVSQQIIKNPCGNITLFSFDKGQQLSEHSTPFNAVVHIIDGNAEIHVSGRPHLINAGDMIILPANIPHAVYAKKRFKMLLTIIKNNINV